MPIFLGSFSFSSLNEGLSRFVAAQIVEERALMDSREDTELTPLQYITNPGKIACAMALNLFAVSPLTSASHSCCHSIQMSEKQMSDVQHLFRPYTTSNLIVFVMTVVQSTHHGRIHKYTDNHGTLDILD